MPRFLILIGLVLVFIGLIWQFAPGALSWFGRLPGDIRIENEQTKIFIPVTSMILISIVLTIIANLLGR